VAAVAPHEVVKSKGAAVGRITGINHIALVCQDMDATVRFYRDILGLRVIATSGEAANRRRDLADIDRWSGAEAITRPFTRQYFFQLPNGDSLTFYEMPDSPSARDVAAPIIPTVWPGDAQPAVRPSKMDHLAFHVPTRADVQWFMKRLTEHGIEFGGPLDSMGISPMQVTHRIYFWDPSGIAVEIATFEADPDDSIYFLDTEPVPALLEP
jgi:catechol 2,3-dioxygenase-like lactoylglutathione lyase family enzyme